MKVEGDRKFTFRGGPLAGRTVMIPDGCPMCSATWMLPGTFKIAVVTDRESPHFDEFIPAAICESCGFTLGWVTGFE